MEKSNKLKPKEKEYIARCIGRAHKKNNKLFDDNNFKLEFGKCHMVWNFIYSNLAHTFRNNNKFIVGSIKNVSWNQIYVYNKFTKQLYIVVSENTFKKVINQKNKSHLIALFANINDGNIDKIPSKYKDELNKDGNKIIPKRSTLITFKYNKSIRRIFYKYKVITPDLIEVQSEELYESQDFN